MVATVRHRSAALGAALGLLLSAAAANAADARSMPRAAVTPDFSSLYSFPGGSGGSNPFSSLMQGRDGTFYGTTAFGGSAGKGTIFKRTPAGVVSILYSFKNNDGANPYDAPVQGANGVLYGTTFDGGTTGRGTVFKITPGGVFSVLHTFTGGNDGAAPHDLTLAPDGTLYGTALSGGSNNNGTVYSLSPQGAFTTLHVFTAGNDGAGPQSGLLLARDGYLYGTTSRNGPAGHGTVFVMTTAGKLKTIYSFTDGSDGGQPLGGLIQGRGGLLYGTTSDFFGTVFSITLAGKLTTLHAFAFGDGILTQSFAKLVQTPSGVLYGTAYGGGSNYGTIYRITPAGSFSVVYTFANSDGAYPYAGLIQAPDHLLYGATSYGGSANVGTIFRLPPM